jgi:hypothetical protein
MYQSCGFAHFEPLISVSDPGKAILIFPSLFPRFRAMLDGG